MKEKIEIFDSRKGHKVEFSPIKENQVSLYICGPTVYDDAHLGHARSAIAFDLLRRLFEAEGYQVTFVKNFTDIDDKIINKSHNTGDSIEQITRRYIDSYLKDMASLGVKRADIEPKATESLPHMFQMIEQLLQKGYAYHTENGDVYFRVDKDPNYGNISHRHEAVEDTQQRIQDNDQKQDSRDFALWKSYKGDHDVGYESPFGRGRPGWHIECSAMIEKHFDTGKEFAIDIHGGGSDLLFPHHENEASQTRCATHHEIAKYWMHNGFVTINEQKMSKSLGNSFFVRDALKEYSGEALRFYLLSTHYRSTLNFSTQDLSVSKKRLDRLYRLKKRLLGVTFKGQTGSFYQNFKQAFRQALREDLNVSVALSILDDSIASANETLDKNPKDKQIKQDILGLFGEVDALLGVGGSDCIAYFQQGVEDTKKQQILALIEERDEAKKQKDFQKADQIRTTLQQEGIFLSDTPQGTIWEKL